MIEDRNAGMWRLLAYFGAENLAICFLMSLNQHNNILFLITRARQIDAHVSIFTIHTSAMIEVIFAPATRRCGATQPEGPLRKASATILQRLHSGMPHRSPTVLKDLDTLKFRSRIH